MDIALLIKAAILGVVEGLTEFLPISSTGHLILAGHLLEFNDERGKAFEVIIQLGAILAVCWEFRKKIILRDSYCLITLDNADICESAHIIPYSESKSFDKPKWIIIKQMFS